MNLLSDILRKSKQYAQASANYLSSRPSVAQRFVPIAGPVRSIVSGIKEPTKQSEIKQFGLGVLKAGQDVQNMQNRLSKNVAYNVLNPASLINRFTPKIQEQNRLKVENLVGNRPTTLTSRIARFAGENAPYAAAPNLAVPKTIATATPLARLVGSGLVRGGEMAAYNAATKYGQGQSVGQIARGIPADIGMGFAANTALSPNVLKGAGKEVLDFARQKAMQSEANRLALDISKTSNIDSIKNLIKNSNVVNKIGSRNTLDAVSRNLQNESDPEKVFAVIKKYTKLPQTIDVSYYKPGTEPGFARLPQKDEELTNIWKEANQSLSTTPKTTPQTVARPVIKTPKSSEEVKLMLPSGNADQARATVQQNLQGKLDNLENRLYGSATSAVKGGEKGFGTIGRFTLPIQEKISSGLAKGMSSENNTTRRISGAIRSLFGQTGKTITGEAQLGKFKGADASAIQLANDVESFAKGLVGGSDDALKRIHSVLDPEISSIKVNAKDLTQSEKQATNFLREVSDYINDSNFAQGKISYETWQKGTGGRYITRAYDEIDLPPELSKAFKDMNRGKQELGMFKQRGDITDWKLDHAIEDPAYLVSKRLQQTYRNEKLADYADWVSKQPNMVSDVERAGYTKLSDSPVWGALSGKNVRQDIIEGIRGFYSDHKAVQGLMDALDWYDKLAPRQFLKKTKTIFNPVTRVGNQIGNRVFALLNGINPFSFEKNIQTFAKNDLAKNGQITRLLRQNGVLGTDFTRTELVQKLANNGADKNILQKADEFITKSYGDADDHAKIAAMKHWLDKGKTVDEALRKVRAGFQNYNSVGFLYNVGAKIPVFGNAFVRFQGDLVRMLKNAAIENPVGVAGLVGGIYAMGKLTSKWSGETEEDKKTRENRLGVPKLPFTNISLEFQTPFGAVNGARLFGLYDITPSGEGIQNRLSRQMPIQIPTNKKELGSALTSDPLIGPLIGVLANIDFRGKSVRDPEENKYQETTLTPTEQNLNRLDYLSRGYVPPFGTDIRNVVRATQGKPDVYGSQKTPIQAGLKLAGLKVQKFGPEEAQKERDTRSYFEQRKTESNQDKINAVIKDKLSGKINQETADKRIKSLSGSSESPGGDGKVFEYNGAFNVLVNGRRKEFDTRQEADRAVEMDKFDKSGKEYQQIGDSFYSRDKDGSPKVTPMSEIAEKQSGLTYTLKLEQAKRNNDIDGWFKLQDEQLTKLEKEYNGLDPQNPLDALRMTEIENKVGDISATYTKYKTYGGFTKPKKAKKPKIASFKVTGKYRTSRPKVKKVKLRSLKNVRI